MSCRLMSCQVLSDILHAENEKESRPAVCERKGGLSRADFYLTKVFRNTFDARH